ncbi:MAG TPA: hypothetical protein VG406_27450 [Isosphaeraceae bacterium]|jgi:hypothetical protein|nr:hypothetical protein [Isosphaeraceae bacterium]
MRRAVPGLLLVAAALLATLGIVCIWAVRFLQAFGQAFGQALGQGLTALLEAYATLLLMLLPILIMLAIHGMMWWPFWVVHALASPEVRETVGRLLDGVFP